MRTLRVLLAGPPDPARPDAWALFDPSGRVLAQGHSVSARWPASERREAVLAADAVRVVALTLPPLPRKRLLAAATFALEDQLATPADAAVVAVGERGADGSLNAVIAARELVASLITVTPPFTRALAEPQLAQPIDGWQWCESDTGAFVRTGEGAAFAVSRAQDDALPGELALALAQASRDGRTPAQVVAYRPVVAAALARWKETTGVRFVAGDPWRWESAAPASFANAIDLLVALQPATPAVPPARRHGLALTIAALALLLHVVAAVGTWAWQRVALARAEQALVPLARGAGARTADARDSAAAIAMLHAAARHRAGLHAPTDAMPVLARAAPALAALPAGALRTATWTAGSWTLELAPLDEATLSRFAQSLDLAGLSSLHARTANGVRARVTLSS